ncbi:DUF3289 family protein [Enterobacter sp. Ap-916]|uniref:YPO3983 family protein n=1 Tax=unclassified Enterobacter TaxID=2608935 RepID=UPI0014226A14|nr:MULTISPECIES: YPO3983 family protein [unclassified Enterobacter]NIF59787.1 DUF3289 family protein [Enterobacter sp. Ap-867]NIG31241.1 DUF3289 family protein [Enterobacter sp. Ap-916]
MPALQFPCTIFKTQKKMDDYTASDMRCGDLSEIDLKARFHLVDVSTRVNPYTLTAISPFSQPKSMFHGSRGEGDKLTQRECANILFDEFRHLSRPFACHPPYNVLIKLMISHMQKNSDKSFCHPLLDSALEAHILSDSSSENSTRLRLQKVFGRYIDWENKRYPLKDIKKLGEAIMRGKLPKLDRFQDNFNGLGITVHDTWATHITIKSLVVGKERYRAVVHYKVQDHFGLDDEDISKVKFNQFRFFRIWFVLQRYSEFAFKPFMTNMQATIEITGGRNDIQK